MISETTFNIILWASIIWFYVGSILIWYHAIPELYSLVIKKKDVDKKAILEREQAHKKGQKL